MEVDEFGEDYFPREPVVSEPLGSPWPLLVFAATAVLAAGVLLLWDTVITGLIGYGLAAFISVTAVAAYRYIDGRRQTLAHYRPIFWAGKVCVGLLAVAWIVACAHAWELATIWATP